VPTITPTGTCRKSTSSSAAISCSMIRSCFLKQLMSVIQSDSRNCKSRTSYGLISGCNPMVRCNWKSWLSQPWKMRY